MRIKSKLVLILLSAMMLVSTFSTPVFADDTSNEVSFVLGNNQDKEILDENQTISEVETKNVEGNLSLEIQYCIEGTDIQIAPSYSASLIKDSGYNVDSPEIKNYTLCDENEKNISGKLTEDKVITVYYRFTGTTTSYKVIYIGRDYDGSNETILEETTCEGIAGTKISLEPKAFDGYLLESNDMTVEIAEDGTTEKKIYYVKKTMPTIIFENGLGASITHYISAEPGTDISTLVSEIKSPTRQGYIFDKWDKEIPTVMPSNDVVITAIWKPGTSSYVVQYFFENAEDSGYTRNKGLDEIRTATTDTTVTASQEDIDKADEKKLSPELYAEHKNTPFFGFDYKGCEEVKVTPDGKGVLKVFYAREIWTIKLMDNLVFHYYEGKHNKKYGTTEEEFERMDKVVWKEFEGKYGSKVPTNFPTRAEIVDHILELNESTDETYKAIYKEVGSYQDISEDSFSGNFSRLKKPKWRSFDDFTDEDTDNPKSHVVHGYPAMVAESYIFDMNFMLEKLDSTGEDIIGNYEPAPELYRTTTPVIFTHAKTTYPYIEGFNYKDAYVQSYYENDKNCCDKKWVIPSANSKYYHDVDCSDERQHKITEHEGWNEDLQAVKINDEEISNIDFMPNNKLNVGVHTTFYLKRARNNIVIRVGNKTIKTIDNIPYGKPLKEIMVPVENGLSKTITNVPLTEFVPDNAPAGYEFAGWSISNGDTDSKLINEESTMISTKLNLYAVWKPIKPIVKVTFDSNGGSLIDSQEITFSDKAIRPENPTKKGFKFVNWYANGDVYNFNDEVKDDLTLLAVWQPLDLVEYHVTHKIKGTEEIIAEKVGKGVIGNEILVNALGAEECGANGRTYVIPDKTYKTIVLKDNSENEVVFYYHTSGLKNYTVSYYLENTDEKLHEDLVVENTKLSAVTEKAIEIDGYRPLQTYITLSLSENGDNHIIFYYSDEPVEPLEPTPTSVNINAQVLMNGEKPQGEKFEFILSDQNGIVLQTKHAVDGNITFDELTFDKVGEYTYKIYEKKGNDSNIDYDSNIYTLVAKVQLDEENNALLVETVVKKNGSNHVGDIIFINKNKEALPDNSKPKNDIYIPNTSTKRK